MFKTRLKKVGMPTVIGVECRFCKVSYVKDISAHVYRLLTCLP